MLQFVMFAYLTLQSTGTVHAFILSKWFSLWMKMYSKSMWYPFQTQYLFSTEWSRQSTCGWAHDDCGWRGRRLNISSFCSSSLRQSSRVLPGQSCLWTRSRSESRRAKGGCVDFFNALPLLPSSLSTSCCCLSFLRRACCEERRVDIIVEMGCW